MDKPSSSKVVDEIVLDSDTEIDDDEVVEISEDSTSSDEGSSKEDEKPEKSKVNGHAEVDEEEEDVEEEGGSESESLESEEEVEDEENSDEDESEEESEGDDSVWDSFDEENVVAPSQEANEAAVLRDYSAGLEDMVSEKPDKARKAFEKVLKNPMVSVFHKENICWEGEFDENLSKMARLFIGCHKNLVSLDEENRMGHLLQVLSLSPKNNQLLWEELGFCSLEQGDPTLAKYAFKRAETEDGNDALVSVFYLTGEYHACLEYIKIDMDKGNINKKFMYLKERIRDINKHFRQFHDDLFQEDRIFGDLPVLLTDAERVEMQERLRVAQEKYGNIMVEQKPETYEPLEVEIDLELDLKTVCILFCDLFDRIESYSSLARQKIYFKRWDNHQDFLDSKAVLDEMVDLVEATEDLLKQVDDKIKEEEVEAAQTAKETAEANVRKSMRMLERRCASPDTMATVSMPPSVDESQSSLPPTELSAHFKLQAPYTLPLLNATTRPSRTPTPNGAPEFFSETFLLCLIRSELMESSWTMKEICDVVLLNLAEVCPVLGSMPKHLHEVMIQLYRRLNRMCSNLEEQKYLTLHVLMDDLGDDHGRDYTTRWHNSENEWLDRSLAIRYVWNCARFFTRETTRLEYLEVISRAFEEDEVLMTGTGTLCLYDIHRLTEKVSKVERIRSIKLYAETNMYEEVVNIMSTDIEFSSLEVSEIPVMLNYWFRSLFAMNKHQEAADLMCRVLTHFLKEDDFDDILPKIMEWFDGIQLESVGHIGLSALGFTFSHVIERKRTSWMYWKKFYKILRAMEGPISADYISSLTASSHDEALPLQSLELLSKAHEALGAGGHCAKENKGEFIVFMIEEMAKAYEHEGLVQQLIRKENAWILCNMDEEIDQLLHCAFGRYSKRRKQMSEHYSKPALADCSALAVPALTLAIPRPLPLFEDKERLGHDVPELIVAKFQQVLSISQERKQVLIEFKDWMKRARKEEIEQESISWPHVAGSDTELEAVIWYLMALSSYRQNSNTETKFYCQLFLTSGRAKYSNPVTTSAWGMLAHTMIANLFNMDEEDMFRQWEWRTMAYRIGIHIDPTMGILHFQLGNALYQTATVFKRYIRELPSDHYLYKHRSLVGKLRQEAQEHFETCVLIPPSDNKIEEYQWLSFFFLAKLHAKRAEADVVKVVDNFFEAACSCELGDFFYYPLKINIKKQGNLEPVELHYQLYNSIWKYLRNTPDPEESVLLTLLSYARGFRSHKVVKSANSLFKANPELEELLLKMCVDVDKESRNKEEIEIALNDVATRVDLIDELWNMCYKAFELVYERFPHHKAAYRLAEMEIDRSNFTKAHDQLLKGVFRRKKKEDAFFDNFIEIGSPDITRSGSHEYHVERATALLLKVLIQEKDAPHMLQLLATLITAMGEQDEANVKPAARLRFIKVILAGLNKSLKDIGQKHPTTEIVRVWQKLEKYSNASPQLRVIKEHFKRTVQLKVGDLSKLAAQQSIRDEQAKKPGRKRKFTTFDLGMEVPRPPPQPILPRPTVTQLEAVQLLVQNVLGTGVLPQ